MISHFMRSDLDINHGPLTFLGGPPGGGGGLAGPTQRGGIAAARRIAARERAAGGIGRMTNRMRGVPRGGGARGIRRGGRGIGNAPAGMIAR